MRSCVWWRRSSDYYGNAMTISEAIDIVISRTGIERYRWLCSEENSLSKPNDREAWRQWIIDEANGLHELPDIEAHLTEAASAPRSSCCGSVLP